MLQCALYLILCQIVCKYFQEGKWIRNSSYISPHFFKNIKLFFHKMSTRKTSSLFSKPQRWRLLKILLSVLLIVFVKKTFMTLGGLLDLWQGIGKKTYFVFRKHRFYKFSYKARSHLRIYKIIGAHIKTFKCEFQNSENQAILF